MAIGPLHKHSHCTAYTSPLLLAKYSITLKLSVPLRHSQGTLMTLLLPFLTLSRCCWHSHSLADTITASLHSHGLADTITAFLTLSRPRWHYHCLSWHVHGLADTITVFPDTLTASLTLLLPFLTLSRPQRHCQFLSWHSRGLADTITAFPDTLTASLTLSLPFLTLSRLRWHSHGLADTITAFPDTLNVSSSFSRPLQALSGPKQADLRLLQQYLTSIQAHYVHYKQSRGLCTLSMINPSYSLLQ